MTTLNIDSAETRTLGTISRVLAIAGQELKIIFRNKTVLAGAVLFPVGLAVFYLLSMSPSDAPPLLSTSLMVTSLALLCVYLTVTTTLATRRQELFLKRLRSGESSDNTILLGMAAPVIGLVAVQLVVVLAALFATGQPLPTQWAAFGLALAAVCAMCATTGVLTSIYTPSAAAAQITTLPYFGILLGTLMWSVIGVAPELETVNILTPGGAVYALFAAAWAPTLDGTELLLPLLSALAWTLVPGYYAGRNFKWDKR